MDIKRKVMNEESASARKNKEEISWNKLWFEEYSNQDEFDKTIDLLRMKKLPPMFDKLKFY